MNDRNMSFSERKSKRKSMSGVNSGWSNYLLSLHSFQSECWAWLSEYNPLILFCSLIRKPGNGQMRLDRCWKSGLIFLIARCTSDTLCSPLCDPSLERKRNDIYLLEVFLPFTTKKGFFVLKTQWDKQSLNTLFFGVFSNICFHFQTMKKNETFKFIQSCVFF